MDERNDCFDELIKLTKRFVSNEEKAFHRLLSFAAGDWPPMDEHGNYTDHSAELDRQRKHDGQQLLQCITKCFDFEKGYGHGRELLDALTALEKEVSSLNEWKPEVDLQGYESEEACWQGGLIGVGWDRGTAKLRASIELVEQSLENVLRLRLLARQKASVANTQDALGLKCEGSVSTLAQSPCEVTTRNPGINARMLDESRRLEPSPQGFPDTAAADAQVNSDIQPSKPEWWSTTPPPQGSDWHNKPLSGTKKELAHCVGIALRKKAVDVKTLENMHGKSIWMFRVNETSWQAYFHTPEFFALANAAMIELRKGKPKGAEGNQGDAT